MRSILPLLVVLASVACLTSPTRPGAENGTLNLHYGETVMFAGTPLSFTGITDSRCPSTVTCVWAGDAAVRLESGAESLVLHTNSTAGAAAGEIGGLNVTLLEVKPERVTPDEVRKSDYVISIRVSR